MTPNEISRTLELVDRIIGLENQLAELKISAAVETTREIRSSITYRVGEFVLFPLKTIRRIFSRTFRG